MERNIKKILIVDDEEMVRFTIKAFLDRMGYISDIAASGNNAMSLLEDEIYDLVISDIVMPGMDGVQFMRAVKKKLPGLDFIMMTGHAVDYAYIDIIDSGASDYMTKPFEMKELDARLARIEREKSILKELNKKNNQLEMAIKKAEEKTLEIEVANQELIKEINERKKIEQALKEAKGYIENIISSMADSLIVLKPDFTISMANKATCDLLEYDEGELIGEPFSMLLYEGKSFADALRCELIENGYLKEFELHYRSKSGEIILTSFLGSAMFREEDKKELIGIICVAHDMRAIKELQNQVFQAEKMASIGMLAAGVAHEIKNPLAIILQGIEFMAFTLSSNPENSSLSDSVNMIREATLRADKIVKGLLDYSRQSHVNLEEINAISILEETIILVKHQLESGGIDVIYEISEALPKIIADKNQLKQVFINILINAAEAMPKGGTITIHMEPELGDKLMISFADTGHGIPANKIEKVLEPFYSTKIKTGSIGLGLSISEGIVEKLGGTLVLKSEVDKGTEVIISLPCIA